MTTTEPTPPTTEPRRIIGTFVKQQWGGRKGDDAIHVGEEEFDATDAVLLMAHKDLVELEDGSEGTDDIGRNHVQWDGPCEVQIVDSIEEYFGAWLEDLTVEALESAKALANPTPPQQQTVTLTIKVNVLAANDADLTAFVENLDYSVKSKTPGVVVKDTEITDYFHRTSLHERPRG